MNTKNIDTFLSVSEYASISAAAEALFISPPALQQQLNRLEAEIGFRLFVRSPGGIHLTPAGTLFRDGMIRVRSDTERLLASCREADSLNKCLRIGAIIGLQPDLFPRLSGPFYQKYPDVMQKPVMESEEQLFSDLDSGALDAVEYFESPRAHAAGRNFVPLIREGRDVLMSPGHPLAAREELTFSDLRGQHIIVYRFDRIPGFREYVETNYPEIQLSEEPKMIDFYSLVRSFEDGHVSLVPPHVKTQFQPLRAVPLKMDMSWSVGLVYREPMSPMIGKLVEVAKEVFGTN